MQQSPKQLNRLLDANFNRSREGLRVCEDICRFLTKRSDLAGELRAMRHRVTRIYRASTPQGLLKARDVNGDTLKEPHRWEKKRADWSDVYWANIQRSKESLRVLEEALKLKNINQSRKAKRIRFNLYELEKKSVRKFPALRHR